MRHPKFTLGIGFLVLCTFLLLANRQPFEPRSTDVSFEQSHGDVPSLRTRLKNAETAYQDMLKQRKGLIHKFGPSTDKIDMLVTRWSPGWSAGFDTTLSFAGSPQPLLLIRLTQSVRCPVQLFPWNHTR